MTFAGRKPRDTEGREAAIRHLAAAQYGLFTLAQATEVGFTVAAITRRVDAGICERVLPRVYRLAGGPPSGRQAALAACLWAGPDAVVSHRTAGLLWDLDGIDTHRVHITVSGSHPRSPLVDVHRSFVSDVDRTMLHGIPITTAARTIIDLAAELGDEAFEAAIESGLDRGHFTERYLRWRADQLAGKGRAGIPRLRAVLCARRGEAALESKLEVKVWRLLLRSGLPRPVRQYWVNVGRARYRIDFAWPDRRVAVEAEGRVAHGGRKRAFYDDRSRLVDLVSSAWRVVPVTWEDVTVRPQEWLTKLAQTLAHAA